MTTYLGREGQHGAGENADAHVDSSLRFRKCLSVLRFEKACENGELGLRCGCARGKDGRKDVWVWRYLYPRHSRLEQGGALAGNLEQRGVGEDWLEQSDCCVPLRYES